MADDVNRMLHSLAGGLRGSTLARKSRQTLGEAHLAVKYSHNAVRNIRSENIFARKYFSEYDAYRV
jgi:hypothetical protein